MKKKKYLKNVIKLLFVGLCLTGAIVFLMQSPKKTEEYRYCEEYVQLKELPALLDFYFYTEQEWEELLEEEGFGEVVTYDTVAWILEQTGSSNYIFYEENEEEILTRAQWNEIYGQLLDLLDEDDEVDIIDTVILEREEENLVCTLGTYEWNINEIDIQPMTAMGFYIKDNRVIGIHSLKSKSAALCNVYVTKVQDGNLEFLNQKEKYHLALAIENPSEVENHVCDLIWENGEIAKVQVKEDTIQGNLIAVNETTIEIEGYGEIARSETFPVYKTYGTVEEKELSDIVIANMQVEYVVAGESVEAVLLTEPAQISRIRVLLLTEDSSAYRKEICIGANAAYEVIKKEETTEQSAEQIVKASELFENTKENSMQIKTTAENGELYLCDENGNRISYGYQGSLELRRYEEGFTIVNELSIEQYLCAVVPSEMPAFYETEALKAQAICARSYAYIQLERGDYAAFGAHVDDTTNYQVYNKQERNEKTTAAVLDTAGMVISYSGETAEAYYFSTSAGVTGDGEAWNLTADSKYGYLKNTLVKEGGGELDLSTEEAFAQFITVTDADAYESSMPYYRWKAIGDYTSEDTMKKIKGILKTRKEKTPQNILFFDQKQQQIEKMKNFGNLVRISITKRSVSGVILQIQMEYEKGTVLVGNEYNIRAILGAGLVELILSDLSSKETSLLPSAYTTLTPLENGTYSMIGGGLGHGIGMSQNGAAAMASAGKSCEEIIKFFFKDIEIKNIT